MIGRILNVVLIACIIACPLWCGQGYCGCTATQITGQNNCCADCDKLPNERNRSVPSDPCDDPCDDCTCLCDGAILTNTVDYEWLQHQQCAIFAAVLAITNADPLSVDQILRGNSFGDDGLTKSGREIRFLHMSLIC